MAELRKEDLWVMADKLRNNMDSAEYKHVCLGLIFLKYISDSFERAYQEISQDEYADPEDRDEYLAKNVFWVPQVDWDVRESVRAQMRITVKRLLRKYKYPPDKQATAVDLIIEQAEKMCESELDK